MPRKTSFNRYIEDGLSDAAWTDFMRYSGYGNHTTEGCITFAYGRLIGFFRIPNKNQFKLVFFPSYDAQDGVTVGIEDMARLATYSLQKYHGYYYSFTEREEFLLDISESYNDLGQSSFAGGTILLMVELCGVAKVLLARDACEQRIQSFVRERYNAFMRKHGQPNEWSSTSYVDAMKSSVDDSFMKHESELRSINGLWRQTAKGGRK